VTAVIRAAYDEDAYRTELRAFGVWCIALGFGQFAYEDGVFPIRHFYQRWGAAIAIERQPSVAARLHATEQALGDPDPAVRDQAVREAAEIVQAAYREVAGAGLALTNRTRPWTSRLALKAGSLADRKPWA
jgi:hypothetical protein